ncbi:MAG: hypothetical protein EAZ12_08270 [Sphingobacteriia bacterium]|nr:MAG: hypothetical protein EAZ12_08270 [Sphingobacteriia bacterium]
MRSLLTVTALLEGCTGLALAFVPTLVASKLLGTSFTDPGVMIIAKLAGAALITIAIACWLSRSNSQSTIMVKAMLAYNFFSIVLLSYSALGESISGPGLWPAVFIHLVLLIWCLFSLKSKQQSQINT